MSATIHLNEQGEPCPPPNTDIHVYLGTDMELVDPAVWSSDHEYDVRVAVLPSGSWRTVCIGPLPVVESP